MHYRYQLILLDITSSDFHFQYAVEQLRKARHSPIMALSSLGDAEHIEEILSVADDFLEKPYEIKVCKAKIKALVRRFAYKDTHDEPGVFSKDGTLMIDIQCKKVFVLDKEITLPRKQFDLLYVLAVNEGHVFSHDQLYRKVWGDDLINGVNSLSCQIRKLRRSLESVYGAPSYIATIRGVGYRFDTNMQ